MKAGSQIRWDKISCSVMSDCLPPHESQHARPPCPSPTPGVHSDSCASSQWCHPAISSSVIPFSSCSQSFPASESILMSQLFAGDGQNWSFSLSWNSFSIIPSKESQGWSPSEWTGWISLHSTILASTWEQLLMYMQQEVLAIAHILPCPAKDNPGPDGYQISLWLVNLETSVNY